jgi:hypothetical protein
VEPPSQTPADHDLEAIVQRLSVDRARLDAVTARVDALELELPLGQVEVQEELERLEALLEAALARLAKLEAAETSTPRPRGVIGALRVERTAGDAGATD